MPVPKLRFKDRDGKAFPEWEKCKLGNLLALKYGKEYNKLKKGNIPVLGTGGVITYVDQYLYNKPSVLIGRKGTIDNPQFINTPFWTVDTLFYSELNRAFNPFYIALIAKKINWYKYNEATGVPSLNATSVHNIPVYISTNNDEQTKIADFLTTLDTRINQKEKQCQLLENYKKGIMQQIFSQQLRFKDDNGRDFPDWRWALLEDFFHNFGGTALECFVNSKEKYYFISIGNYSKNGTYIDNGQRIILNDKTRIKKLNKNDLVMILNDKTKTGDIIGATILINEDDKYIYNQRSERLVCKSENLSPLFAWFYINSEQFRKKVFAISQGGTQIYVNYSSVKRLPFPFISPKEQTKIANLLTAIDDKINLAKTQLAELNSYKKGLLQQLFI